MKWFYRLGLIALGCYFENAVRNATGVVLYWFGKSDLFQGLLPYAVPVVLGYLFALDIGKRWTGNRLANDVMGYSVAVQITGYPLLFTGMLWVADDPSTLSLKWASTGLLVLGAAVTVLIALSAARKNVPFSLPWGTVSPVESEEKRELSEEPDGAVRPSEGEESEASGETGGAETAEAPEAPKAPAPPKADEDSR